MKKRYKSMLLIGAGVAVYGMGGMLGISLFDGSLSSKANQPETASAKINHVPVGDPVALSKWLTDIQPAAGGPEGSNK